ncbi:MAG: TonB-dependent receptor [Saprospiraceae bacterium]|nr:TonB-dependent receptor [Saprospiraceae bacterium]
MKNPLFSPVYPLIPLILALLLISGISSAQDLTQTIRGVVVDADTQLPLIGAEIVAQNTEPLRGDVTDAEGRFRIQRVPIGRITLRLYYMGYETVILPNVVVNSGRETVLTVLMQESSTALQEVVINAYQGNGKPNNSMALLGARSISMEEMNRLATGFNDPALITSNFAGVTNSGTGGNDIIVRGNSPKYMQWRLDGVPITNPNHFADQNAAMGTTSILNSNLLATSDFFTGAFPSEFGNVLSGIYDVRLRNGNNEKFEATLGVGLIGTDITVEGPLKKGYGGSFIANYRYSTSDVLSKAGLIEVEGNPKFQDAAFKLKLPTQNFGTFSVFGIGGNSKFNLINATPENADLPGDDIFSGQVYEDYDKSSNLYNLGLNHTVALSDQSYLKSSLSISLENLNQDVFQKTDSLGPREQSFISDLKKTTYRGSTTFHQKIDAKNTFQAGIIYTLFDQNFNQQMRLNFSESLTTLLDFKEQLTNVRSFVSWKHQWNERVTFVGGIHNNNVIYNNEHTLEPRLSVQWKKSKKGTFNLGYGLNSRMESVHHYFAEVEDSEGNLHQVNKDLGLLKAHHINLGYEYHFSPNLVGKIDAYYQHLFDLPVEYNDTSYFSTINEGEEVNYYDLVNEGTGQNYGIELSLQRYFSNHYYFLVNTSIYESTYKTLEGRTRNTRFNGNYLVNIIGGKEFVGLGKMKNKTIGVNAKFFMGGGQRIIPLLRDGEGNVSVNREAGIYWDYDKAFENKIEDIYQITLSMNYRIERPTTTHEFFLTLENITNNKGKLTEYYDSDSPEQVGHTTQFGLLPNFMYRLYF